MPAKPFFVLRESPRLIPERIREYDAGIRGILRPSLLYGMPCALIALYFYHTEIAPFIDPPPQPNPAFGLLVAPFLFPLFLALPRLVLSAHRFRNAWRTTWSIWPKALVRQSVSASMGVPWRNVTACVVEPQGNDEVSVRLTLSPQLRRPSAELVLICLRADLPCDADSLRERIAGLMTAARRFSD